MKGIFRKKVFDEKSRKNLVELKQFLKLVRGQKIIGYHFNPEYTELLLHLEDFVIQIDLKNANWKSRKDMRVFISPIIETIPWPECPFRGA